MTPAVGALKGLIRVLAYEHPDLRTIDRSARGDDAVATLTAELESSGNDDLIAWRGSAGMSNGSLARHSVRASVTQLCAPMAHIVTGGLGGVGMVVARWLVDSGAGRVSSLVGRVPPTNGQTSPSWKHAPRSSCAKDIASPNGRTPGGGCRRDRAAVARSRPLGGRDGRPDRANLSRG